MVREVEKVEKEEFPRGGGTRTLFEDSHFLLGVAIPAILSLCNAQSSSARPMAPAAGITKSRSGERTQHLSADWRSDRWGRMGANQASGRSNLTRESALPAPRCVVWIPTPPGPVRSPLAPSTTSSAAPCLAPPHFLHTGATSSGFSALQTTSSSSPNYLRERGKATINGPIGTTTRAVDRGLASEAPEAAFEFAPEIHSKPFESRSWRIMRFKL